MESARRAFRPRVARRAGREHAAQRDAVVDCSAVVFVPECTSFLREQDVRAARPRAGATLPARWRSAPPGMPAAVAGWCRGRQSPHCHFTLRSGRVP